MAKKYLSKVYKDPLWHVQWINVHIYTGMDAGQCNPLFTLYSISDSAKEAFDNLSVFTLQDIADIYGQPLDSSRLPSANSNFEFGYTRYSSGSPEAVMACHVYNSHPENFGEFVIKDSTLRQTIQTDVVKVPQIVTELPSTITDDAVGTIYYVPVKQYTYNCQAPVYGMCVYDPVITLNEGDTIVVNSNYATKCGLFKPGGVSSGSYIVSEPPITYTATAFMDVRIGTLNDDQGAVYQIIRANDVDLDGKWIITERYVTYDEIESCAPDFVAYSLSSASKATLDNLSTPFTIWDLKDICGSSLDGITLPSDGTNFQFGYATSSSGTPPNAVVDCEYCYSPQRGKYHAYIASKTSGGTTYYKKLTDEGQMTIREITNSDVSANINVELDCCYIDKRNNGPACVFILPPVLDYGANLDSQVVHRIEFYLHKPNGQTATIYSFRSSDGKPIMKLSGLTFNSSYEYFLTATWNGFLWTIDYVRVNNY